MKSARYIALFSILTFAFSLGAFAANANSGSFDLSANTQIGSAKLAPGHYKAEWSGPASNVKVSILHDGKQVATANGQLKDLGHRAVYDEILMKTLNDNTQALQEIQFHHRNEALDFSE